MTPEHKQEALAAWPEWWGEAEVFGRVVENRGGRHEKSPVLWCEPGVGWWGSFDGEVTAQCHPTAAQATAELLELCPEPRKPDDLAGRVADLERRIEYADAKLCEHVERAYGNADADDYDNVMRARDEAIAILRGEE